MSSSAVQTDAKVTESKSATVQEIDNNDKLSSDEEGDDDVPALEEGVAGTQLEDDSKQNRQEKKARKAISKMGMYLCSSRCTVCVQPLRIGVILIHIRIHGCITYIIHYNYINMIDLIYLLISQ